jgi:hypothetical protein
MVQFRPAVPRRFRIHLTQLTLASVSAPLKRTTRTSGLNTVENLRPRERGCVGSISLRGSSSSSSRAAQPEHRQLLFCQANRPGMRPLCQPARELLEISSTCEWFACPPACHGAVTARLISTSDQVSLLGNSSGHKSSDRSFRGHRLSWFMQHC